MKKINIGIHKGPELSNVIFGFIDTYSQFHININDLSEIEQSIVNDLILITSKCISININNFTDNIIEDSLEVNIVKPLESVSIEPITLDYSILDENKKGKILEFIDLIKSKI